jgi:uncharacterized protein (TIGR00369 family)
VESQTPEEPASGEVQNRISASFDRQGLMTHLGARLTHVGQGRVRIALPHGPRVTQQDGYFHAGATSAIADSAGGYAALTLFPDTDDVLTVEYKINLIAPATGDSIEAVGTVIKSGRTVTVCQLEVFAVQDTDRTLVALGQQTLMRLTTRRGS